MDEAQFEEKSKLSGNYSPICPPLGRTEEKKLEVETKLKGIGTLNQQILCIFPVKPSRYTTIMTPDWQRAFYLKHG